MTSYSPVYTSVLAVQNKTGLTNSEVDLSADDMVQTIIQEAELELEMLTGRKFVNGTSCTELINVGGMDILDNKPVTIQLSNFPVQSITSMLELDIDGNTTCTFGTLTSVQISAGTYATTDYWLDTMESSINNAQVANGKIVLKTRSLSKQDQKIKVAYTYGYATVPVSVRNLATCLAGIRAWVTFMGGCYNRLDSYSIPSQNVSKGDFYERAQINIQFLQTEADRLLDRIGRKSRTLFFASGGVR